jgi:ribonuclease VapC
MTAVIDASAFIALLEQEPGWERVAEAVDGAYMVAANYSEMVGHYAERGMPIEEIHALLEPFGLRIFPMDQALAEIAGLMKPATRNLGLSLADRACLALAKQKSLPVYTADRVWGKLSAGIQIIVIR